MKIPEADTQFFGGSDGDKKVSDMISADTKVMADGSVKGTLHNISGFTKFSNSPEEQGGHFFPMSLTKTGQNITVKKNGTDEKTITYDKDWVLRVNDKNTTFEFLIDGKSEIKLNFTQATLE